MKNMVISFRQITGETQETDIHRDRERAREQCGWRVQTALVLLLGTAAGTTRKNKNVIIQTYLTDWGHVHIDHVCDELRKENRKSDQYHNSGVTDEKHSRSPGLERAGSIQDTGRTRPRCSLQKTKKRHSSLIVILPFSHNQPVLGTFLPQGGSKSMQEAFRAERAAEQLLQCKLDKVLEDFLKLEQPLELQLIKSASKNSNNVIWFFNRF